MDFAESRFFWPPAGETVFLAALCAQLEDFSRAVQGQPSQAATASDAVAALVAAEAATAALRQAR
jgi:myo-inositol 2-dehydrogenase/D-chiro-inositol 1-dehydrogenase